MLVWHVSLACDIALLLEHSNRTSRPACLASSSLAVLTLAAFVAAVHLIVSHFAQNFEIRDCAWMTGKRRCRRGPDWYVLARQISWRPHFCLLVFRFRLLNDSLIVTPKNSGNCSGKLMCGKTVVRLHAKWSQCAYRCQPEAQMKIWEIFW